MSINRPHLIANSILFFVAFIATFLNTSTTFATDSADVVDEINITIPVSCTLSGTNLLHTDTIQNNQYKTDIGSATIKATCNDTNGLAVYAIGYTNETDGNNKMHSSTLDSSYDIVTGKYVSGTTTNSVWSMKLTPVSGTYAPTIRNDASYNYTNYEIVPSDYTKVAYRTTATDTGTGSTGANFTTDYAVYASATQPAGTYTGKVKFTVVHPQDEVPAQPIACEGGKICYNPNTALVEGQMGKQTAGNNAEVTLYAPNFKRTGYGFAGWNTAYDYSGTTYGPNETITTPADTSTNGLSLYAVWVPSAGTLQNWNGCNSLAQGSVTALTDNRDNDTYAVAKLADGKCWMIENLRLDDSAILSVSNTNNPSLPLTNIYDTGSTSNHLSPTSEIAYNATTAPEGWCTTDTAECIDQSRLRTDYTTLFTNNTAYNYNYNGYIYSYGNYYNWYSATAGQGVYEKNRGDADGDICPNGWHLPGKDNSSDEVSSLDIAMGGTGGYQPTAEASKRWRSYPLNYVYTWYVSGNNIINKAGSYSDGHYWKSSADSYTTALSFEFTDSSIALTGRIGKKSDGLMVRCIAGV